MIVTFCGHSDCIADTVMKQWLRDTIISLIDQGAQKFYLGGYGGFDCAAANAVWDVKNTYPQVQSVLVLPYLDRKVNSGIYDYTTYPPLESVPRRFAISRRNEWMMDAADVVVAYVTHDWGGAASTLAYAIRKKRRIVNYADDSKYYSRERSPL